VLLSVADCQAKTDESAVKIILGCTAETRQPRALEVTQSYGLVYFNTLYLLFQSHGNYILFHLIS